MSKPKAVLISDIHYNITTLPVADAALRQAVSKANELRVPLIIAGDLHDTKANLRGECVSAMLETFKLANERPYLLIGNHDRINEKSVEHSLTFLERYANIVNRHRYGKSHTKLWGSMELIPYHHDPEELRRRLKNTTPGSTLIMHQGINGSNSGEYIQDKSAINKEDVADFRVISGHYHTRQDIKIGRPGEGAVGLWSYIGNPYTLNFGEANDPEKGFQILMDDGTLEFVPTNLRKHVVIEMNALSETMFNLIQADTEERLEDLILVKLRGPKAVLDKATKTQIARSLKIPGSFRLDLIPDDETLTAPETKNLSQPELLDQIIESISSAMPDQKQRLKTLWKDL